MSDMHDRRGDSVQVAPGAGGRWIPDESAQLKPSAARIYDYMLGGAHNFAVDRQLVERLMAANPNAIHVARVNRAFLRRAVLYMVNQGIRQFLDLGSGIPTVGNVHEIAQKAGPDCRVVYVDYEGVAVAHSELLLEGNDNATVLQADVTMPDAVLHAPRTRRLINFDEPLGLLVVALLHYISPAQDPGAVLRRYREIMAPGSYLAISHATRDFMPEPVDKAVEEIRKSSPDVVFTRTHAEVLEFFGDFELVEPGLVTTARWRPDGPLDPNRNLADDALYAGVARKNR